MKNGDFPDPHGPHDTSMDSSRCDSGAVEVDGGTAELFSAAVGTGAVGVAPRRWWTKVTLELPLRVIQLVLWTGHPVDIYTLIYSRYNVMYYNSYYYYYYISLSLSLSR